MFRRVFGPAEMNVPLGLEYMNRALRDAGFASDVCNLDYGPPPSRSGKTGPALFDGSGFAELKKLVEDPGAQWWLDFRQTLLELRPSLVGISMVTPQHTAAVMAARIVKETLPETLVVAGGIHCTAMPEETLASGAFDAVAVSEGERTIVAIAKAAASGGGLSAIPGLCVRGDDGAPLRTAPVEIIKDLDALNFPVRECIVPPGSRDSTAGYSAGIITGRGCPFHCVYCARNALWLHAPARLRSVENVVEELAALKKDYGISYFYILDDTFNFKRGRVAEFCEALMRARLGLSWQCKLRPDLVDEPQARLLRRAGCDSAYLGVESGSPEILRKMKRAAISAHAERAVANLKRERVFTICSFIAGHPDETPETFAETESLIRKLSADRTMVWFMIPYPGSELYAELEKSGAIRSYDWFSYAMNNATLIRREGISDDELIGGVLAIYASLKSTATRRRWLLQPARVWKKLLTVRSPARFGHLVKRFIQTIK